MRRITGRLTASRFLIQLASDSADISFQARAARYLIARRIGLFLSCRLRGAGQSITAQ
jgi:hypothetical protein